jgi:arylsulfatase A-like enzyme
VDSRNRQFHSQAAGAIAARGAVLVGTIGAALGVVEILFLAVVGELDAVSSPARYPAPYVGVGLLIGAVLGPLALLIDATLRRLGRARPRAGLLVPMAVGLLPAAYGVIVPTAVGARWQTRGQGVGAFVIMWLVSAVGAAIVTRRNPPADGWRGWSRGVEMAAASALSICVVSLFLLRAHPSHVWERPGVQLAIYPLAVVAGLAIETFSLRAAPLGRLAFLLRPVPLAALVLGAMALATPFWRSASARAGAGPNVLLVVMDGARYDSLSAVSRTRNQTPGFDSVATTGVLFERARSPSPWCLPGHLAILTGTSAATYGVNEMRLGEFLPDRRRPTSNPTLAERLARRGYATAAFSNNPWVGPNTGLDAGFAQFFEVSSVRYAAFRLRDLLGRARADRWSSDQGAAETGHAAAAWLRRHRDRPFLLFVNLVEPMPPYTPIDPYLSRAFTEPLKDAKALRQACEDPVAYALGKANVDWQDWNTLLAVYQAEVAQADAAVAELLQELAAAGIADRTIVAVTADHGQTLSQEDRLLGNRFTLDEGVLRVPLAIRGPGVPPGGRVDTPVSTFDLVPTLLELTGTSGGPAGEGRSLVPLLRTGAPRSAEARPFVAEYDRPLFQVEALRPRLPGVDLRFLEVDQQAVVLAGKKLVRNSRGRRRIYDLNDDPDELNAIVEGSSAALAALPPLEQALDSWLKDHLVVTKKGDGSGKAAARVLERIPDAWW